MHHRFTQRYASPGNALREDESSDWLGRSRRSHIGGRTYMITRQMLDDFRGYDMQQTLGHFTKPVLIFHAPGDETLRFSHALRLLQALTRGSQERAESHHETHSLASLISLPGADHLPNQSSRRCRICGRHDRYLVAAIAVISRWAVCVLISD